MKPRAELTAMEDMRRLENHIMGYQINSDFFHKSDRVREL